MSPRELAPVNGAPVQIVERQGMRIHPLAFHGFFGMFAEGGGGHNQALRERAFTGFGKEGIQVLFGDAVVPELALKGPEVVTIGLLRHQINPTIRSPVASGPILPEPYVRKLLPIQRIRPEKCLHETFKLVALIPCGACGLATFR